MTEQIEGQMSIFDLGLWCGKMFAEHSAQTAEKISEPSSKKQRGSQIKTPLFLDLRRANGHLPAASWEMGGALLGEYTMHSFGEFPSEERESRLSQILQGGGAPEILFEREGVSRDTAESGTERESPAAYIGTSLEETGGAISFQERAGKPGGGKGILIQNERIGTLSTLNNQSVLCLNDQGGRQMDVSQNISGTLRAQEHGHQPIITENRKAVCVSQDAYDKYTERDQSATLKASGGTYGGSEVLVIQ